MLAIEARDPEGQEVPLPVGLGELAHLTQTNPMLEHVSEPRLYIPFQLETFFIVSY